MGKMNEVAKEAKELLSAWDSPETKDYVLCRGIDSWKWRCYALVAGVVDGRKWKGSEVARAFKLSRARICVVLKEVERKLTEDVRPERRRLYRQGKYDFLRHNVPVGAVSVWEYFGTNGGRHRKYNGLTCPRYESVVFVADGELWVQEDATTGDDLYGRRFSLIWCSKVPENCGNCGKPGMNSFFGHPLLVNCGEAFYVLDKVDDSASPVQIYLKKAKFKSRSSRAVNGLGEANSF